MKRTLRPTYNVGVQEAKPDAETLPEDDVRACLRVLRAIEADRSHLARLGQKLHRELTMLAGLVAKPERHEVTRMAKAFRRAKREAAKEHDRKIIECAGLRIQRRSPVYTPLWLERPGPEERRAEPEERRAEPEERRAEPEERRAPPDLLDARNCYVCKKPFTRMHRYYDSMCEECGEFNYAKREQSADLEGHYALVTGARVKIGFQASLKLLRAGAHVIATTRFPVDAAERYAAEPDFAGFRARLQIHGIDLRHTPSVELLARLLGERLPRLDYILNNACQTVRRPAGFFKHLLAKENQALAALPEALRAPLAEHVELRRAVQGAWPDGGELVFPAGRPLSAPDDEARGPLIGATPRHGEGLLFSALLSQRRYLDEDFRDGDALFPRGRYDEDRQQVDLREVNSWRLRMHEVETPELLEVHLVNALAPFILNARLKPLMARTPGRHKHIVNVSAMEGQFYRAAKTDKHPHTNMAKAALNMMTRTSAADYVKDGIHMNAVDTGWVTDEDPAIHASRKAELGFAPPLDIIDGAARILDPIFAGHLNGAHVWGQFLKDYKPAPW